MIVVESAPSITSISSANCTQSTALTLANCPRSGNALITVIGANFGAYGARVIIGSQQCIFVRHDPATPHTKLTCFAPSGNSLSRPVLVMQSGGVLGPSSAFISYQVVLHTPPPSFFCCALIFCPAFFFSISNACLDTIKWTFRVSPARLRSLPAFRDCRFAAPAIRYFHFRRVLFFSGFSFECANVFRIASVLPRAFTLALLPPRHVSPVRSLST